PGAGPEQVIPLGTPAQYRFALVPAASQGENGESTAKARCDASRSMRARAGPSSVFARRARACKFVERVAHARSSGRGRRALDKRSSRGAFFAPGFCFL